MPLDIDRLPTARGTVARTLEEFSSGPVLVPYKVNVRAVGVAGFFQAGS